MRTIQIAATSANDVHELTLKAAPARVITFLHGASEKPIRAKLQTVGYTDESANEVWAILNELRLGPAPTSEDDPARDAIEACEEWQSTGFIRARAMMQISHPEQASFIFRDFEPATGMAAVLNVATFLARYNALANGAERKGTRKPDHDALQALELGGVSKETVKGLAKLVETAQTIGELPEDADPDKEKRMANLRKCYVWITAWSEVARTAITRRDQLIRLGLAKRRAAKGKATVVPADPTPVVVTPPAPVPVTPPVVVAPVVPPSTPTTPTTPTTPVIPTIAKSEEESPDSRAA